MRHRQSRESELRKDLFSAITDEADGSGTRDDVLLALDYLLEHYARRAHRIATLRMQNRIARDIQSAIDTADVPSGYREGMKLALHVAQSTSREVS